jgi:catechol 2,3-dioxygenase-like lactoylglutathione lyase family enzyme
MENVQHTVIPVLRIFDIAKTKEFYVAWLGFTIGWEHRFGEKFFQNQQKIRVDVKQLLSI